MANSTQKNAPKGRTITAMILSASGVIGSYRLISAQLIGESSFCLLACSSVFIGLVVAFIDRIQSFSMRDLKVEMAKVEESKKEVEELAYLTVNLVLQAQEFTLTASGYDDLYLEFQKVARDILKRSGAPDTDPMFRKIDDLARNEVHTA